MDVLSTPPTSQQTPGSPFLARLTPTICRTMFGLLLLLGARSHWKYLTHDCPLNLSGDEAHYWDWSRQLELSYYSKGPLVAYIIRASCVLLGAGNVPGCQSDLRQQQMDLAGARRGRRHRISRQVCDVPLARRIRSVPLDRPPVETPSQVAAVLSGDCHCAALHDAGDRV